MAVLKKRKKVLFCCKNHSNVADILNKILFYSITNFLIELQTYDFLF